MNCFSGSAAKHRRFRWLNAHPRLAIGATSCFAIFAIVACNAPASEPAEGSGTSETQYRVRVNVTPSPVRRSILVELTIQQSEHLLRQINMTAASDYFSEFGGDGVLDVDGDEVSWRPPADGGTLRWRVDPNRKRSDTAYDAYLGADWALFRASDIFPPAATRTLKGAVGITTLQFDLPRGWSSVTQYKEADGRYPVDNPQRRFDRPTGWILLGNVGTRTDDISGTRVTVAAPANHGIRRMDMLAMLRWTLPEIRRLFDDYPNRITVFSAGEPMWRGGLSAPSSVYVHSGRPLISENGTSTLLHELVHVGMGMSAHPDADWIIEGFAEYYSLQLLLRSGSISKRRYDKSIAALAEWGQDARGLCSGTSGGAVTAKATAIMHDLNIALKSKSEGASSLDDVMRVLVEQHQKLKTSGFVNAVNRLAGQELQFLQHAEIANCTDLQT